MYLQFYKPFKPTTVILRLKGTAGRRLYCASCLNTLTQSFALNHPIPPPSGIEGKWGSENADCKAIGRSAFKMKMYFLLSTGNIIRKTQSRPRTLTPHDQNGMLENFTHNKPPQVWQNNVTIRGSSQIAVVTLLLLKILSSSRLFWDAVPALQSGLSG